MKVFTEQELHKHFGKLEYKDLSRGWVKITNDWESKNMIKASLPFCMKTKYLHRKIYPALLTALRKIESLARYNADYEYIEDLQIFAPRHIAHRKSNRLSAHTWGIAFDVNPWENMPGDPDYKIPMGIIDIFENVGFYWGGRFSIRDYMHFEPSVDFFAYSNYWDIHA